MRVLGVDGCRAGWFAVEVSGTSRLRGDTHLFDTFRALLELRPRPDLIALDIPIGLLPHPEPGGRCCDREARKLLGPRRSSVFSPPTRAALRARHYDEVRQSGVSIQTFGLFPKIREVDRAITPQLQRTVREAHPELAFTMLRGGPLQHAKRTSQGRQERLRILERPGAVQIPQPRRIYREAVERFRRADVAHDDILDALALANVALAMSAGEARRVPARRRRDARGLDMSIWF